MNKKALFILLAVIIALLSTVFADKSVLWQININGSATQIKPATLENQIYLPLSQLAEALNFKVQQDASKNTIFLTAAQEPKQNNPTSEYGAISGNVKFRITENSSINFEAKEATLTAPADKPFTSKELKNHFYGEQSSYFYHHFSLYKTKIDKDGNFAFSSVKPGEYDLLVFAKRESTWGYQRVAWKLYVNVEAARVTKVRLDNYNNAIDDFVYLQM